MRKNNPIRRTVTGKYWKHQVKTDGRMVRELISPRPFNEREFVVFNPEYVGKELTVESHYYSGTMPLEIFARNVVSEREVEWK